MPLSVVFSFPKKCVLAIAAASLFSVGLASESTQPIALSASGRSVDGFFGYVANTDGAGGVMLSRVVFSTIGGAPWTFPNSNWEVVTYQTHILVNGDLVQLPTARSVGTSQTGTSTNTYSVQVVLSGMYSQADQSYRTGRYSTWARLYTSGVVVDEDHLEWQINRFDIATGQGGGGGGGGGVGASDPTEEGQQNFWTSIFVPDEDCLNDVRDAATAFTEWGPLGLFTSMLDALGESENEMAASVELPVSAGGFGSTTMAVDTGLWDGLIGTVRSMLACVIWFGAIWTGWRMAQKFMG